jgi:hypothetical protein
MKRADETPTDRWEVPLLLAFPLILAIVLGGYLAMTFWGRDGLVHPGCRSAIAFGLYVLGGIGLVLLAAWRFSSTGASDLTRREPPPTITETPFRRADVGQPWDGRTDRGREEREEVVREREAVLLAGSDPRRT